MLKTLIALTLAIVANTALADAYDYCLKAQKWVSAGGPSGTTTCGFVNKNDPTCRVKWTSSSAISPPGSCWEQGADMVAFGCQIYDLARNNLLGDIAFCRQVHTDKCTVDQYGAVVCTRHYWFSYMATPDDGDGN
jgi:hypothetical protein